LLLNMSVLYKKIFYNSSGKIQPVIRSKIKILIKAVLLLILITSAAIFLPRVYTDLYARPHLFQVETVPSKKVAVVFGAGLNRDGSPGAVLRDRVNKGAELYFSGRVDKLLMSGDNRFLNYNEPGAMRQYALSLGVPDENIVMDFAGRRTYDTCYRAFHIFGVEEAILVTQRFHLPRALYTCNKLGVEAVGVPADRLNYAQGPYIYWNIREVMATANALWEVHFARPLPVLGEFEPIFSESKTGSEKLN
jgi:SanA protein